MVGCPPRGGESQGCIRSWLSGYLGSEGWLRARGWEQEAGAVGGGRGGGEAAPLQLVS